MKTISTGKAFNELDSKELGKWGELGLWLWAGILYNRTRRL